MASAPNAVDCAGKIEKVCTILDHYERRPSALVPILNAVLHEYRYLPDEALTLIATALDITEQRVSSVASLHAQFALQARGKHVIRVCDGTACQVKRSLTVLNALHEKLGTGEKNKTSTDLMFTVETAACMGTCDPAPVIAIDGQIFGEMSPERAVELIDEIRYEENLALGEPPKV